MGDRDAVWERPVYEQGGGDARIDLYCFSERSLDLKGSAASVPWCPYDQIPNWLHLSSVDRASARPLFDRILAEPLDLAAKEGFKQAEVDLAKLSYGFRIEGTVRDPADLGHLQVAWAMALFGVKRGASAVFDDLSRQWQVGQDLLEWPTPLDRNMDRETRIIEAKAAGRGPLVHTRGMVKFGRPDLLMQLDPKTPRAQVEEAKAMLAAVQEELAGGRRAAPGRYMNFDDVEFDVERYQPGQNAVDVALENEGLLFRPRS